MKLPLKNHSAHILPPIDLKFCMCSFATVLLNWYVSRRQILIGSQFPKNRQLTKVLYVVVAADRQIEITSRISDEEEERGKVEFLSEMGKWHESNSRT
jgi:hypothetical protein